MEDTLAILSDESLTIVIFFYDKGTFFSMKVGQMTNFNISILSEAFFAIVFGHLSREGNLMPSTDSYSYNVHLKISIIYPEAKETRKRVTLKLRKNKIY